MGEVETFDFTKDGFSFDEIVGGGNTNANINDASKKPVSAEEKLVHKEVTKSLLKGKH